MEKVSMKYWVAEVKSQSQWQWVWNVGRAMIEVERLKTEDRRRPILPKAGIRRSSPQIHNEVQVQRQRPVVRFGDYR